MTLESLRTHSHLEKKMRRQKMEGEKKRGMARGGNNGEKRREGKRREEMRRELREEGWGSQVVESMEHRAALH